MHINPVISLMLAISLIIIAARLGGALLRRLGQPRVLGELIVGVILGPTVLNMLGWEIFHDVNLAEPLSEFAEIGVVLLMFLVGMEVNIPEFRKSGKVAAFAGVLGGVAPVLLTVPVVLIFQETLTAGLFAGVVLAATSVSISAQVLFEIGVLHTKEGNALLATALVDDVLAILMVSIISVTSTPQSSDDVGSILGVVVKMLFFFVAAGLIAWFGLPLIFSWVEKQPLLAQNFGVVALGFACAFLFAALGEMLAGVAAITGSFIAGVGISRCPEQVKHKIEDAVAFTAYGLFVPIFFVNVGLQSDLRGFRETDILITVALLIVAIVSKLGGCGLGGLLGGFNRQQSLRLGVCMISRGEVGLIILAVALASGVIVTGSSLYNALFVVILLTTLITPPLVRLVFPKSASSPAIPQGVES